MHFDTSPGAFPARRACRLILAVLMLAACGERVIVGREPADLASSEPALDAGGVASPQPEPAFEPDDEEDSGGDDDADPEDGDGDENDDESDGEDDDP